MPLNRIMLGEVQVRYGVTFHRQGKQIELIIIAARVFHCCAPGVDQHLALI